MTKRRPITLPLFKAEKALLELEAERRNIPVDVYAAQLVSEGLERSIKKAYEEEKRA